MHPRQRGPRAEQSGGCAHLNHGSCTPAAVLLFASLVGKAAALEPLYALAFVLFGVSDFREAYTLQSWLILYKAVNLVALLWLRHVVIRRFYPASRLY